MAVSPDESVQAGAWLGPQESSVCVGNVYRTGQVSMWRTYAGGADGALLEKRAEKGPSQSYELDQARQRRYLTSRRACWFLGALRTTVAQSPEMPGCPCVNEDELIERWCQVWQRRGLRSVSLGVLMRTNVSLHFTRTLSLNHFPVFSVTQPFPLSGSCLIALY